jgi:hypothetical protein
VNGFRDLLNVYYEHIGRECELWIFKAVMKYLGEHGLIDVLGLPVLVDLLGPMVEIF